jgi:hypothetical protein
MVMGMANNIKKGESLLIPFRYGISISDSQMKPRMYKTMQAFKKSFPGKKDGVELAEYAEVVRCKDCKHYDNSEGIQWCKINSKFYPGGFDWHSFPEDGFCSYGERKDNG